MLIPDYRVVCVPGHGDAFEPGSFYDEEGGDDSRFEDGTTKN